MDNIIINRVGLPTKLGKVDVKIFGMEVAGPGGTMVKAICRKFGMSYDVAIGLIKALQGVITNFFHRSGKVAFLALYDTDINAKERKELLTALSLTEEDLTTYTTEEISVYVHQLMSNAGEACMTEVLMDRRKHIVGAPDRFDAAVADFNDLISGKVQHLSPANFLDSKGEHIMKGDTTVRIDVINAVVRICGVRSVTEQLQQYPINDALVGGIKNNDTKIVPLCKAITQHKMKGMLDMVHGRAIEPKIDTELYESKSHKISRNKRGVARLVWNGNASEFMAQAILNANTMEDGQPAHDIDVRVNESFIKITYFHDACEGKRVWVWDRYETLPAAIFILPMPTVRQHDFQSHECGGLYIKTRGGSEMYARNTFLCLNRHASRMAKTEKQTAFGIQFEDVRLVNPLEYFAHKLVDQLDTIRGNMGASIQNGTFYSEWKEARTLKATFAKIITAHCRYEGKDLHNDGYIYETVNLLPLQAAVEQMDAAPMPMMNIQQRMAQVISSRSYVNPLNNAVNHHFNVGAAPKGGSGAHVTLSYADTGRSLPELVAHPFAVNTDRSEREAAGKATAQVLENPYHVITTEYDALLPGLLERSTDLAWAWFGGENFHFKEGGAADNPDGIYHTDDGLEATKYVRKQRLIGPLKEDMVDFKAQEIMNDPNATLETLVDAGWKVGSMRRPQGQLDSVELGQLFPEKGLNNGQDTQDVFSSHITLKDPNPLPESNGRKFGLNGTKHVSVHTPGRLFVKIGGKRVYLHVLAAIETVQAKKIEGDVFNGHAALLGKVHDDRSWTMAQTEAYVTAARKAQGIREDGTCLVYTEDGKSLKGKDGLPVYAFVSLHRTFVMKEDENMSSSFKEDGMSNSPWSVNLFGGELNVSPKKQKIGQMLADLVTMGALMQEADGDEDEEEDDEE